MPKLLHILTKSEDALAAQLIATQEADPQNELEKIDLTQPEPDYKHLLEKIFEADSIQVW